SPLFLSHSHSPPPYPHSFPTRRSSDLYGAQFFRRCGKNLLGTGLFSVIQFQEAFINNVCHFCGQLLAHDRGAQPQANVLSLFKRSEEHTSELQSRSDLVCRLLLEKKKY